MTQQRANKKYGIGKWYQLQVNAGRALQLAESFVSDDKKQDLYLHHIILRGLDYDVGTFTRASFERFKVKYDNGSELDCIAVIF